MTGYTTVALQLVLPAALLFTLFIILAAIFTALGLYFLYWLSGKFLDTCWWVQDKAHDFRESVKVWS